MHRPSEKRKLPVQLSELELLERGKQLADTVDQIAALEKRKAEFNAAITEELKAEKAQQAELAKAVETGEELHKIRCEWTSDMGAKEWALHRDDTGEVIQRQTMTAEELQMSLHAVS